VYVCGCVECMSVCGLIVSPYLKSLSMVASTKLLHLLEVRRFAYCFTCFNYVMCCSKWITHMFLRYVPESVFFDA